jgi:SAM-dependent methyltransferase
MGKSAHSSPLSSTTAWWHHHWAVDWLAAEGQQAQRLLGSLRGQQVLELLPEDMPRLSLPEVESMIWRQRQGFWYRPVYSKQDQLPLVDNSLDVVVWRYLAMRHSERIALLAAVHRCLRPGGLLLMAALNPLQPWCWRACGLRQLGRQAVDITLPLHLQGFKTQSIRMAGGRRLLRPVRLILLRKPGDPRIIRPLHGRLLNSVQHSSSGTVPSCRAA